MGVSEKGMPIFMCEMKVKYRDDVVCLYPYNRKIPQLQQAKGLICAQNRHKTAFLRGNKGKQKKANTHIINVLAILIFPLFSSFRFYFAEKCFVSAL